MLKYRKELDGLRCLAVMAVIIYHAGISLHGITLFKGGFFGVDVFLVLSGYLITNIIINSLDDNKFSLLDFYWRRIKRIVPALVVMLFISSIAAWYILLPNDLMKFSDSLKSALYFGSNYYFLGEDSYVSDASIFKPLLHTWSLAVEWQFYLFYPFVILFINTFFKRYRVSIILSLSIVSLFYANYIVPNYPDLAFYTLPPRAWELMLGGLMGFISFRKPGGLAQNEPGMTACKMLPTLGMFMILYAMVFIDNHAHHPSFVTLLPVIGTCLIIAFANDDDIVTAVLSLPPIVFIGAISYSMYLWHQPVFVFFRFIKHEYITWKDFAGLTALTLLLSYLSYRFVESPFRARNIRKKSISGVIVMASAILVFSYSTQKNSGFPNRLTGLVAETYEMYKVFEFRRLRDTTHVGKNLRSESSEELCTIRLLNNPCRFGDESWVTLGDSFAGQFDYSLWEATSKNGIGMISLTYEQCPFIDKMWFGNFPECPLVNDMRWEIIKEFKTHKNFIITINYEQLNRPKIPIANSIELAKQGFSGGETETTEHAWNWYADNIKKLISMGHDVYVIYPIPGPSEDVEKLVFSQLRSLDYKFATQYTSDKNAYNVAILQSEKLDSVLPDMKGLHKIRPVDALCDIRGCKIIDENGGLYNYGFHLSSSGVKEVLSLIDNKIFN